MMTGEQVGVGHDPQRGAAYVENWVKVLEKDPHEIRRAAGDAQKMTNYLMDRAITQERGAPDQDQGRADARVFPRQGAADRPDTEAACGCPDADARAR